MVDEHRAAETHKPPAVLVTYQELVQIRTCMAVLSSKLDTFLALESRVKAIELSLAGASGERNVWRHIWNAVWGLLLAVIAAGVYLR